MDTAGSLLHRAIRRAGIGQQVQGFRAQAVFAEALERELGVAARRQARARSLRDGMLTVAVDNSALASEIQLRNDTLVEAINKKLGAGTVNHLRLVIGSN